MFQFIGIIGIGLIAFGVGMFISNVMQKQKLKKLEQLQEQELKNRLTAAEENHESRLQ